MTKMSFYRRFPALFKNTFLFNGNKVSATNDNSDITNYNTCTVAASTIDEKVKKCAVPFSFIIEGATEKV
jgi:hypothetical protein